MRLISLLVISMLAFSLAACSHRQPIKYPMEGIGRAYNDTFEKAILAVRPFEDDRKPLAICTGKGVSKIERGEKTFYYNCDQHYKSKAVTREISNTTADHLNQAKLFKKVILDESNRPNADYLLTGRVVRFDGFKEYRPGAVVASKFGPIGSMINRVIDSSFEGSTVLDDLSLIRLSDNAVIWKGSAVGHVEGTEEVDPDGWTVYEIANLSLKDANAKLLKILMKLKSSQPKASQD